MTLTATAPSAGLRGQLNKLRNLAQPFFLPLDQASGWQFAGLLIALLFCVGGLVLVSTMQGILLLGFAATNSLPNCSRSKMFTYQAS